MFSEIIDGKKIAGEIKQKIHNMLSPYQTTNLHPKLVIIYIGYNKASEVYIKYKMKFACECNIEAELIHLDANVSFEQAQAVIQEANNDDKVNGIMVQLPIDSATNIDSFALVNCIDPNKDVDGLTAHSLGLNWFNNKYNFCSSTAAAVMHILKDVIHYDFVGKNVVIIGQSIVLGKPLAGMIVNEHATLSILNSKTKDISFYTKNADLIISATGQKNLIKKKMVKTGVVLIDVGTNKDENNKLHGDFDPNEFINVAKYISPSPGGVGPITVSMLIYQTAVSFIHTQTKKQEGK